MRFADIPGHEEVKKALVTMADTGRVAHAMLLYENEGCGALSLSLAYLQYLNCSNRHGGDSCGECPSCRKISKLIHPDVHFVYPVNSGSKVSASKKPVSETYLEYWRELVLKNPYFLENEMYDAFGMEGKSGVIAVAEAKSILEKLSLSSVEDGYKAVVIWLPEKMNAETANRLLKVIEEPPLQTIFLLITHNQDKVLQTIFSRCQCLRIAPWTKEEVAKELITRFGIDADMAHEQASLSGGSPGRALYALGESQEHVRYMEIFSGLMNATLNRDLAAAIETADEMSSLESKEKQKAFCIFAAECVRKIFLFQQGMENIAAVSAQDAPFYCSISPKCSKSFCAKVIPHIDRSVMLLERNVNAKIVFCDLVDQIFLSF